MKKVPSSLRTWFIIHFVVDILFAVPLIFFTSWFLSLFGLGGADLIFARLVGAALVGGGVASFLAKKKDHFEIMLTMKLWWSGAALLVILWSLIMGAAKIFWLVEAIFLIFFIVWLDYKIK